MWQPASSSHRPRNDKLQDALEEKQTSIYENLKLLCKKFSRGQRSYKTLARFYEVCLNLNGSLDKQIPNQEDTAERVGEVIFILETMGVSNLKTKRIEGLCDRLVLKEDVAVSVLFLLLELANYKAVQEREQESSLERFFTRKNHRRTATLTKDTFETHSGLLREPKDVSKAYWRHRRILSLQPDLYEESMGAFTEGKSHMHSSDTPSPGALSHRKNGTSRSTSSSSKDAGDEFIEKEMIDEASSSLPKSIFDFSDKMYQAIYRKHFGSRSKSWIPPNHPLIFDTARWSLISNVSFLIRKNPLGGFEPVASRLQPCSRNILAEFAAVATELFEIERMISVLQEKNDAILQGLAKALSDEVNRYCNDILPLIRKTSYKVHLHENECLPVFGLLQQVRKVTAELHECMVIMKAIMPYGEMDPYHMLRGLYDYQREHYMSYNSESLCARLFLKVFVAYLFALRRVALYGAQFSINKGEEDTADVQSAAHSLPFPKILENMFPMEVKFMVDKAAYGVDILWSINPQHPFFSSNRESLCVVPSFDLIDINYLERQVEEHFANVLKDPMKHFIPKKPVGNPLTFLDAEPRVCKEGDEHKENCSDDELSWLSSESEDSTETGRVEGANMTPRRSFVAMSENSESRKLSETKHLIRVPIIWENPVQVTNEFTHGRHEKITMPFEKFVSELALVSIRGIYYYVQQYLWWLVEERIDIFDQFRAIRDYLLLNRGDFFLELCHSVYNISSKESFIGGTEAEARLQLAFEQAILSSSAANDSRVRYFEFFINKDGNTDSAHIYSQILLQWKPSNLVESALFDVSTLEIYSHIFHFAFKLKSTSHLLRQLYSSIPLFPSNWQGLQRKAHILRFQLMQFVNALLQFYDHGLLGGNWFHFLLRGKECNDIWQLRNLHLQFLDEALSYIFKNDNPLATDINQILDEIILFEIESRRALRKSSVLNISNLGRRIQSLSSLLRQFYDKILLSERNQKVKSSQWRMLMTYFGMIHTE